MSSAQKPKNSLTALRALPPYLLDYGGAVANMPSHTYVIAPEPHEVATTQLAVNGEIKQGEVAAMQFELKADPYRPHLLWFQRALLTDEAALVPGCFRKTNH
jgi:hypothetical protein